jgi:quercetin dioxygenase-like cupin family protein
MRSWNLKSEGAEPHEPRILSTADDARAILLHLPQGEELQEHEVHERARLLIIDGEAEVATPGGESVRAGAGHLFEFDPGERHTVRALASVRLLLLLSPWPGDGHPGAMTLAEKEQARRRAAERAAE